MDEAMQLRLAALNRAFYREHAAAFSASREQPWPGFGRVLEHLPERRPLRVLDVGCGNGRFAGALRRHLSDQPLRYLGIDDSEGLLGLAQDRHGAACSFLRRDFLREALPAGPFDLVVLLGVLHHVPGESARRALLEACCRELARGGLLAVTFWRLDRDPRFGRKVLDPAALPEPIDASRLEPGDRLLGFGQRAGAVRYCHFAPADEQARLLEGLPARVIARFQADGAAQQLNDYALLRRG